MMKYLLLILSVALIGCSPVQPINTEIPEKTIESNHNINTQAATSTISVARKESYFASASYYWISLDIITVMALRSGDHTTFKIQPGNYQLAVDCYGDNAWHSNAIDISIKPGDSMYFETEPALSEYCGISAKLKSEFLQDYKNPTPVEFGIVPSPER